MNFSRVSNSRVLGRLIRMPLRLIPKGAILPILQGPLRGCRWIAESGSHGCWLGSYEYDTQGLFERVVTPGSVVYDVGANVGFYTLLAAKLVGPKGRVIAFEPLPRNLDFLRKHVSLNELLNVEVIDAAVSENPGVASFDDSRNPSMGQLTSAGSLKVRVVTLDDLIASGAIPPPNFIKIDVEGAEEEVLCGGAKLLREDRPTIFLATHGDDVKAACLNLLRNYNYSVRAIGDATFERSDEFLAIARPSVDA